MTSMKYRGKKKVVIIKKRLYRHSTPSVKKKKVRENITFICT